MEAAFMRNKVLSQLLLERPKSQFLLLTGSSLALVWQSRTEKARNGVAALSRTPWLQLPSDFPRSHMQARLVASATPVFIVSMGMAGSCNAWQASCVLEHALRSR